MTIRNLAFVLAASSAALSVGCGGDDTGGTGFNATVAATATATVTATDTPMTSMTADGGDDTTGGDEGSSTTPVDTDVDPTDDTSAETTGAPAGDHALARIAIGETHPSDMAPSASTVLTVGFFPDAATIPEGCGMDVSGCTVSLPPTCAVACVAPEACVYDDNCLPVCQAPCDLACPAGQECYYPIAGATACKPIETFDGGRLDFFGTSEPVSLFPPYAFPAVMGTITAPNSMLTVQGSGSTGPGFAAFEGMVTAADSLISNLSMILPATALGVADLPITWAPGTDQVIATAVVTGTLGGTGTVTCTADDAAGTITMPRAALNAAIPMDTPASMSVTLQRQRTEVTQGAMTQGSLLEETVQPEGWVEFSFVSSETFTFTPG